MTDPSTVMRLAVRPARLLPLLVSLLVSLLGACAAPARVPAPASAPASAPSPEEPDAGRPLRPHVVILLADDLGYADLGFTGCTDFATPHIDALARTGAVCRDAHVSASVCAPSRAGLLTGRYQQRAGFECNLGGSTGLLPGTRTFAHGLQDAGYETALIGKWHLGSEAATHPNKMGFDHFTGLLGGSRSYFPVDDAKVSATRRIERNGSAVPESSFTYLTDFLTDEAVGRIEGRDPSRPLLLFVSYTAPHGPMHARADLAERFDALQTRRAKYAAMVTALDEGVGRVMTALEDAGIADNTLTFFLSDNGGATGNASDNGPWRGMKGSKWEGGHRVPFVAHWPAALGPAIVDAPISSLDIAATVLGAAGAAGAAMGTTDALDGVDLLPILSGRLPGDVDRPMSWRRAVAAAHRRGRWKVIRVDEADGTRRAPILVDLAADPGETTNVADREPERVRALLGALEAWEREMMEPRWLTGEVWRENQRMKHQMDVIGRDAERRLP